MKCVMIINPRSGKGFNKKNTIKLEKILKSYKCEYKIIFTEYRHHATKIIKNLSDDIDLVISMGGDGTFSEVVNGNLKREHPLVVSHLPVGTTNDIGHMYGLVNNIYTNLKLILTGVVKDIDIGLINNHAFTYVASFGKYMDIPYKTPQELKKKLGYFAYIVEIIKRIFERIPKYDIEFIVDGEKHSGRYTFIIISNANRIAGVNNFYHDVKLDDFKFEVMLCSLTKKTDIIKAFYKIKTSGLASFSGIETYKCSSFDIKFNNYKKPWCVDGEEFKDNKNIYRIRLQPNFKIQVPKKNLKKLFVDEQ